jgi:broad specificity phosphatase PhoE
MKPKQIILVRHGESQGNVNKAIYETVPDYALQLTDKGRDQAYQVGLKLETEYGLLNQPVMFYVSPFWRARQTFEQIYERFLYEPYREDARLREQDWGNLREIDVHQLIQGQRDGYGSFFYRFPNGESGADVEDRISSFLDTLHRDFEKPNFPGNVVIVTHGFTMRVFIKRFFHYTTEDFEILANPPNCGIYHIGMDQGTGKYRLLAEPARYPDVRHPWRYISSISANSPSLARKDAHA